MCTDELFPCLDNYHLVECFHINMSLWDSDGCMLAWYSNEKWGTTSEHTHLHSFDQVWWSLSLLLAYASEIWLVAWAGYELELSSGRGQAFSQEGRNVLNQAIISTSVHVGHHYYIAFANKIIVGYDCCSNQVYSFDKQVYAPWDPGKSALRHHPKTSGLGTRRNLRREECYDPCLCGPTWAAITDHRRWAWPSLPSRSQRCYMYASGGNEKPI
jgi:hypothetical protein